MRFCSLLVALSAVVACSVPDPPRPTYTAHRGADFAVVVPDGSRVTATADRLQVDAPDGFRWFDVMWLEESSAMVGVVADQWGRRNCEPALWDEGMAPAEGLWLVSGACTIGGRGHWVHTLAEQRGARILLFTYVANSDKVPFEHSYVEWVTTVLTLKVGSEPGETPDAETLRATMREVALTRLPPGGIPVPGGGVFSTRVNEAFGDLWSRHAALPMPQRFDEPAPAPEPAPVPAPEPEPEPELAPAPEVAPAPEPEP